ncbi:MAG: hypothetical protein F6K17_14620 [Okeania sp. SIO3C4]|nr:hypothetical protein [Okeania sp. SIO3B3]NER03762.1 hypothetical protein [Okeania sp. SIO3C4]
MGRWEMGCIEVFSIIASIHVRLRASKIFMRVNIPKKESEDIDIHHGGVLEYFSTFFSYYRIINN